MAEKTIMLLCSSGMSTSLLVTKMQQAATDKGLDYEIFASSATEGEEKIKSSDVDVLLLGPQLGYMRAQFEEKVAAEGKDIPIDVINMQDYGMMRGENVLNAAINLMNN